jgi:integrase
MAKDRMSFASGEKQASRMMQKLQGTVVQSVRSVANYEAALANVAKWQKEEHKAGREGGSLHSLTPEQAERYLQQRGEEVGQKTLDQERQAIQLIQRHITNKLAENDRLAVIKSELQQVLSSRSYTPEQVNAIAERQTDKNALATQIAHAAGLRAHELLTLRPSTERPADARPTRDEKFAVREKGERYTVIGKGGLCREVIIPRELAQRLENTRLAEPQRVTDRGVFYQSHYNIGGGQRWSNSFSQASNAALGHSTGAHGLRHSYAQERMGELQRDGLSYRDALETVSQEMGHFRDTITEVYLR